MDYFVFPKLCYGTLHQINDKHLTNASFLSKATIKFFLFFLSCTKPIQPQQPYDEHVIKSADKHQQKAAYEGKKLEMDHNNIKDYLVSDEA